MRIAVVGDVGLDVSVECSATKLASEAPAIVFHEKSESYSLAMSANVAQACRALGAEVLLCGVIGIGDNGSDGDFVESLVHEKGIENSLIGRDFVTAIKKRYFDVRDGQRHLVARFDRDCGYRCTSDDARVFVKRIQEFKPDAVIIQDHGKGVVNRELVNLITQERWDTFIDPCQATHPTMNPAVWVGSREEVPQSVLDRYGNCTVCEIIIQKMGKEGVRIDHPNSITSKFDMPSYCKRPVDTVGAGDSFIAALVVERLLGRSWEEACHVASIAAAVKCGRYGTKPVTYDEIHAYQIGTQWQPA